jgi:hypothetical protein
VLICGKTTQKRGRGRNFHYLIKSSYKKILNGEQEIPKIKKNNMPSTNLDNKTRKYTLTTGISHEHYKWRDKTKKGKQMPYIDKMR